MKWIRAKAPVDNFKDQVKEWLDDGFTHATWKMSANPCLTCRRLNGRLMDLQKMLDEMEYDAVIYSQSHCGCKCKLDNPITKE
jgi:hypothetical protein